MRSGLLLQYDLYFKVVAICIPENSECVVDRESIKFQIDDCGG